MWPQSVETLKETQPKIYEALFSPFTDVSRVPTIIRSKMGEIAQMFLDHPTLLTLERAVGLVSAVSPLQDTRSVMDLRAKALGLLNTAPKTEPTLSVDEMSQALDAVYGDELESLATQSTTRTPAFQEPPPGQVVSRRQTRKIEGVAVTMDGEPLAKPVEPVQVVETPTETIVAVDAHVAQEAASAPAQVETPKKSAKKAPKVAESVAEAGELESLITNLMTLYTNQKEIIEQQKQRIAELENRPAVSSDLLDQMRALLAG